MIYDVIGDIHGFADKLKGLLTKLGYSLMVNPKTGESYFSPPAGHRAIFIGDLIDRGPQELETLQIVFAMIDAGVAEAVMGNHEYNALAYATLDEVAADGRYLREHNHSHNHQHEAFLDEAPFGSDTHRYWLSRFYELPLWIESDHACFVHACWDEASMAILKPLLTADNHLTTSALTQTSQKGTSAYHALERVLKGVETPLPKGLTFKDNQGTNRHKVRVKWWLEDLHQRPLIDIVRVPSSQLAQIPTDAQALAIDFELRSKKPIFIGHYWLTGIPKPLSHQVVCTDYSAAGSGHLTAYRFDTQNPQLSAQHFVQYIDTY